jgi:hypothetical protein
MRLTGYRNQCQGCKEYFNSQTAFDLHRRGTYGLDRRCLTVLEMTDRGMYVNVDGFWVSEPYVHIDRLEMLTRSKTAARAAAAEEGPCISPLAPMGKGDN